MLVSKNKNEGAILLALNSDNYFENSYERYSVNRDPDPSHYSAVCMSTFDTAVNLVCTLPTVTRNIYVTVTEGDTNVVRRVLAVLEDFERVDAVRLGNVVLIDDPDLRAKQICGVILLPGNVFNVLDNLPNSQIIDSVEYYFVAVVFLTDEENEIRRNLGHDALMDYWTEIDKDLINFGIKQ